MSASYVIRAVVEEKDSRLVELLLVSVKPMALLAGKILAVMAFTFGWLAMLAGLGVSCGLTAGLMGPGVLQKQLSGLLAAVPRVQEDLWQAAGVLLVLLVSLGAGVSDHVPDRRRGRGLLLRHGGGRRGHGACDAADHGGISGLLRGGGRASRPVAVFFHPVPHCEYFLRPGAALPGQCVLLAGASVLGDPGGGDLGSADPGVPVVCGTHRAPGQPCEAA
ncbi:MAG: ABC transporter permease [Oscillospiraceae bacterium]